jgi:hypothetical protein
MSIPLRIKPILVIKWQMNILFINKLTLMEVLFPMAVDNNQLLHLLYSCHIWGRLNACQTECNKALNWRKMWPKKQKHHTKMKTTFSTECKSKPATVNVNFLPMTTARIYDKKENKNNCFMVSSRRFKWHLLISILHVFSVTRSFCTSSAFLDLNKSLRWERKSNNCHKKRWLKISEHVSQIFYSKHLFIYHVTFLSPLKQMGLVSYNYHLVAKSHIRSIGYHITLVLIFCHWVTRKPYNLWYQRGRNKSGMITNIVKHQTNEMVTLHTTRDKFRANIRGIVVGWYMSHKGLSHCYRFTYGVVANGVQLLLESWFGSLSIMDNRHIVPINVGRPRDTYSHHL